MAKPVYPYLKVKQIIKRNGSVALFNPEKITDAIYKAAVSVGGKDRALAKKLTIQVLLEVNRVYNKNTIPAVEEIQDLVEKVLVENRHTKTAKAFILYRADRQRLREKKTAYLAAEDTIPYKLLWKAYTWNVDHNCDTVEKLNAQMRVGSAAKLVQLAETQYHAEIDRAATLIAKKASDLRVLIVAGPSSSGKTTTTLKLGLALQKKGLSFAALNIDNYFKELHQHPRDDYGDYDYEAPESLELEMINTHLRQLIQGKTVHTPFYNFKTGKRQDKARAFKLEKNQIILIDSLHGLYEPMTQQIAPEQKFKFYIEAMCQIKNTDGDFVRWADLRLLRRMIRDLHHRNSSPLQTVGHWHYVRRSEKQFIVPFITSADFVFNGAIAYELPVYKKLLEHHMPDILKHFQSDPKKLDAYLRAKRVSRLLASLRAFPQQKWIPSDSLLREFIGGSIYSY